MFTTSCKLELIVFTSVPNVQNPVACDGHLVFVKELCNEYDLFGGGANLGCEDRNMSGPNLLNVSESDLWPPLMCCKAAATVTKQSTSERVAAAAPVNTLNKA